jgi:hypothetical protein
MVTVTGNPPTASRKSRLLEEDEVENETLRRLTGLGVELVPGGSAAAVTVATAGAPCLPPPPTSGSACCTTFSSAAATARVGDSAA